MRGRLRGRGRVRLCVLWFLCDFCLFMIGRSAPCPKNWELVGGRCKAPLEYTGAQITRLFQSSKYLGAHMDAYSMFPGGCNSVQDMKSLGLVHVLAECLAFPFGSSGGS